MTSTAELLPPRDRVARIADLRALRDLAGEAAAVDVNAAEGDEVAVNAAAGVLRRLVERGVDVMARLQLDEAPADDGELDFGDEPAAAAPETDAWVAPPPSADAGPCLGDVCFAGALELKRALRDLAGARQLDDRVACAETARRKLRRAIRAVLETAREGGLADMLSAEHQAVHQFADLGSALAVRRIYARFRRALRRPAGDDAESVLVAVRYAAGALATLVAAPEYADVRASDRAVLRRLRERSLAWARTDRSARAGLQLLEDVYTSGDLLRGINRRQELRAHDRALAADLRRHAPAAGDDVAAWLARADALDGLDDALDALLDRARSAAARDAALLHPLAAEVLTCLAQLT